MTRYKIEWDTSVNFNSKGGPLGLADPFNPTGGVPLSFDASAHTSPLVYQTSADTNGYMHYTITGLTQGVLYYVRITACNSLGFNVASGVTQVRLPVLVAVLLLNHMLSHALSATIPPFVLPSPHPLSLRVCYPRHRCCLRRPSASRPSPPMSALRC